MMMLKAVSGAMLALFLMPVNAAAQAVPLGTAATFAVLANTAITNTGNTVVIGGHVGSGPTGFVVTGFPPGLVNPPATLFLAANAATTQANTDLGIAYANLAARGPTQTFPNGDGQLNNLVLGPGVYRVGAATTAQLAAGTLTLDANNDPSAVWIFQIPGTTLKTAAATEIRLRNQAQACNVYWQVGTSATLGAASRFTGAILADTSITVGNGVTVDGRLLAGAVTPSGAVTLDTDAITASPCASSGSITVVKNTVGGNGTFAFTSNFGLASLTTIGGTASQTFSGLTPGGAFSLSETVPAGWTQTSATCTNGTPAAIIVLSGVTTTCIITNAVVVLPPAGSIRVVKNTVGGDGTFAFTSNFGLTFLTTIGGTASLTFSGLTPGGGYNVSETVPAGWTQTSASCTNGTPAAVNVVNGVTTTCTFTNTQQGAIRVVKNTVGGNDTFAFTSNFGLASLTTIGGTASQTFSNLTPGGSYSLSETGPAGWTQTSAVCTNGTPAAITVLAGVTTTCIITNTQAAPAVGLITIVKNTVGGNGTFVFNSNFGVTSPMTTSGGTASQTVGNLAPGNNYRVSETAPAGWTQTGASCTNGTPAAITVVAGVTTTCTFTNTQQGSITVVKNTVGGDGAFAFTSNFGLTSLTTSGGTASQTFSSLTPGVSYSLSETVPTGWAQTGASCTNGTPTAITVVAGVTTTCIITNTKGVPPALGLITVVKNTVGGDGTFAFTSNFGLTSLTTSSGTAFQTFSNLAPGVSYSVNETVPSGWTQTGASCTNGTPAAITVVAGLTTTCTITNTKVAATVPDVTIVKSHVGNFRQGDTGNTYSLTVTNIGQGPTNGVVTVVDTLPAGLTATAISGPGWTCTLTTLTCTRSDSLAPGASYPVITVTVNVANSGPAFNPVGGSPAFQTDDILLSLSDGTVQWRRRDWTLVKVLTSSTDGQAKGMAFDSSGNLYVTHWSGTGSSGNNIARFDRNGNFTGTFGSGFNCNPSSIVFDSSGNAYVGQADCGAQILKFDSLGNRLAQYTVAVENRGSYHIVLDPNQCTMYYTSAGPNVKRFNICSNTQMSNFNSAPLPDPVGGAQQFSLLPGGGMLIANFGLTVRLDASGNLVRTYNTPAGNHCWLGTELDPDGTSFWASDWCSSSVTRFDIATGNVLVSHVAADRTFHVKQIAIPGNIFNATVTNIATVAGGGELNISNDSASDATTVNPPAPRPPVNSSAGAVNAASYVSPVAAGSIASVFGSNLSFGTATTGTLPLPTTLASSSLQIGGRSAPYFFASPGQLNVQIPWELAGQTQASATVTVGGIASNPQTVSIAPYAPGIFTLNQTGTGQGVILIAGTALLAAPLSVPGARPARPGEFLSIYGTGLGAVSNQPATGTAAALGGPPSVTVATPTVTIGGVVVPMSFSGLAPGFVGLYQVNVQVPAGALPGAAVPVILSIGGVASNTVTIAVQ